MNVSKIRVIVEYPNGEIEELMDVVPLQVAARVHDELRYWRRDDCWQWTAKEIIDYLREADKLTKEV